MQYYFETIFPRIPKKVSDDFVDELKKKGLPTVPKGNAGQVGTTAVSCRKALRVLFMKRAYLIFAITFMKRAYLIFAIKYIASENLALLGCLLLSPLCRAAPTGVVLMMAIVGLRLSRLLSLSLWASGPPTVRVLERRAEVRTPPLATV